MRRSLMFAALSLVSIGALGCTNDDGTIYIRQNQIATEGCQLTTGQSQFVSQGIIDVAGVVDNGSVQGYVFTPLIESLAAQTSGNFVGGSDIAFVEGADVALSVRGGDADLSGVDSEFAVRFSASVQPGGQTAVAFEIITPEVLSALAGSLTSTLDRLTVVAEVELFGNLDGSEIRSNRFAYPVVVCNGCLLNDLGTCEGLTGEISQGGACNPFQDGVIDCCDGVCPAVPTEVVPEA